MWGSQALRENWLENQTGRTGRPMRGQCLGIAIAFLARPIFLLADPGEENKKGGQSPLRERAIQKFYKLLLVGNKLVAAGDSHRRL